jgi:hypothetical protein
LVAENVPTVQEEPVVQLPEKTGLFRTFFHGKNTVFFETGEEKASKVVKVLFRRNDE